MNPTLVGLELKRIGRDYVGLFFIAVLPAFMYVVFGAAQAFGDQDIGRGNVALYVMISMAVYGAVTATVSVGGMAAVERMQGWGRQLGLTPLRDTSYVGAKAIVAMAIACIPIGLIYGIGLATGAKGDLWVWFATAAITLFGAALFAHDLAAGELVIGREGQDRAGLVGQGHGVTPSGSAPAPTPMGDARSRLSFAAPRRGRPRRRRQTRSRCRNSAITRS